MLPGMVAASPVRTPAARVNVAGTPRPVLSCTVEREIVGSWGGINSSGQLAATGTVEWDTPDSLVPHPARPGTVVPGPGERVDVLTGLTGPSGMLWPALTRGIIDRTSGSVAHGSMTSTVLDSVDQLNRSVTVPPKLSTMPPLVADGPVLYLGLTSAHLTDLLMRAGGFYATPPEQTGAVFSVTAQGCMWPERGTVLATQATTPIPLVGPQGVYCTQVDTTYAAQAGITGDHELTVNLHPAIGAGNSALVRVRNAAGTDGYSLTHTGSNNIVINRHQGGVTTQVATLPRLSATRCAVRFTSGGTAVELRTGDGRSVMGTQPAMALGSAAWTVQVAATGPIGAVLIGAPTAPFSALTHVPTAEIVYPSGASVGQLIASPALMGDMVLDLLAAQRAAMWADLFLSETGTLTWCHRDVLDARVSMTTKTAEQDLYDLSWSQDSSMLRSAVKVAHDVPKPSIFSIPNIDLWTGSGETLAPSQKVDTWVTIPNDEDWFGIDESPRYAGVPAGPGEDPKAFDKGFGSWVGGYHVSPDGVETGWFTPAEGFSRITRVNERTFLHEMQVNAITAGRTVVQRASPNSPGLWSIRQNQNLAVLRGRGKTEWSPASVTVAAGPSHLPVLTHDAGFWVQGAAVADLAAWLAARTATATTVFDSIPIEADPRVQIGDKITIADPTVTNLTLTGVVVGDKKTIRVASYEHAVQLRVVSSALAATHGDVDARWSGSSLATRDDAWSDTTLAALDADPLDR